MECLFAQSMYYCNCKKLVYYIHLATYKLQQPVLQPTLLNLQPLALVEV